ncbi:hypothetical protein ACOSQ3_023596 [Xanthoceras sorbifolium]
MDLEIDLNLDVEEYINEIAQDSVEDDFDKCLEPFNGMEFDSQCEAFNFYLKYAKLSGYGILTKASRRSKSSKEFIDVKYACTRYGVKREYDVDNHCCIKTNCGAMLHIYQKKTLEHNHELFPAHAHYFPYHRSIASIAKQNIDSLHAVGVGTNKIYAAMAKQNCGFKNVRCLEKDIRNHLDKERRLALTSTDAKAMLEHFMHMQEENKNFFYAVDLDDQHMLKNVFWVDAKSREDYKIFGDVVLFDKTYITNKFKMPFAPFIGVNNHLQSILLGYCFSNTRHHFCLWHILRKVSEKLGHVLKIDEENEWLECLFEDRKYWVPTYMRNTFFAGMSTTQRSESINSFFDKYVNKKTSLKEFIEQYKVALRDREEKEAHANFKTWHKEPVLKSPSPFEKQMSTIYTHEVFKKFQKNVNFVVIWDAKKQDITCLCRMFEYYEFLCRHVMCVLHSFGSIRHIPKEIQSKKQCFDELILQATKLSEEASLSHESFTIAYSALKEALEKSTSLLDPQTSNTKGAPKRIKTGIEKGRRRKVINKSKKVLKSSTLFTVEIENCSQNMGERDLLKSFSSQHSQYINFESTMQDIKNGIVSGKIVIKKRKRKKSRETD